MSEGVLRLPTPTQALSKLELLLQQFQAGDQLFITARTHDSSLSMWSTNSKAAGLYWCASALAKLWRASSEHDKEARQDGLVSQLHPRP